METERLSAHSVTSTEDRIARNVYEYVAIETCAEKKQDYCNSSKW
jgi:pheromone shutdown protein TraB